MSKENLETLIRANKNLQGQLAELKQQLAAAPGNDTEQVSSKDYQRGKIMKLSDVLDQFDAEDVELGINSLTRACHMITVDKGFWDGEIIEGQKRNDGEMIALMHSELSELLEAVRDKEPKQDRHCPEFLNRDIELADLLIRAFDYAQSRGINLGGAIIAKMAVNAARPYKHGRKF